MKTTLLLGAVAVLLSVTGAQAAQGNARRGQAIAQKYCALCHAIGKSGDSPKAGVIPFRDLHQRYPIENLDEALGEGLMINHPDMPEITLNVRQIHDFKAYLYGLSK